MALRCPECGNNRFSRKEVQYNSCIIDEEGDTIDSEGGDLEWEDNNLECTECNHYAKYDTFEYDPDDDVDDYDDDTESSDPQELLQQLTEKYQNEEE